MSTREEGSLDPLDTIEAPQATSLRDEPLAASLVRTSAVVGLGTALSRVTGFVRLFATGYAIGLLRLTDTYTLANNTPNIVYELLLGGVLSATLVPVFVSHVEHDDEEGAAAVVSVATIVLLAITVAGFFAAPYIVSLYTVSVDGAVAADQQEVATALLRLFMPQMLFYGLFAMGAALLNAHRRFAPPAFAPILNNLVVTAVLFLMPVAAGGTPTLSQVREEPALLWLLGAGTTAGIVVMTVALVPSLLRAGIRLRPRLDWHHPSVRMVGRLSGWTVGYVLANQVAYFVVLVLANDYEGGVSAYFSAFIFFQLPHALFAVSIMTTIVPELSAAAVRDDMARYRERFSTGIRLMAFVVLPAATGYAVLAHPIVTALLRYGAVTEGSADLTADTLASFGLGLFGFSVYLFALRGFYALRDTRTPFLINLGQNALQIVLALSLEHFFEVPGLALAYGGAYSVAGVAALVLLRRRVGSLNGRTVARSIGKMVLACAVLAAAVVGIAFRVGSDQDLGVVIRCAVGLVVGAGAYLGAVLALRVEEVGMLGSRLSRRARS